MRSRQGQSRGEAFSGEQLVSDFQTVMMNLAAAQTAETLARQSETDTLQTMTSAGSVQPGAYLVPGAIPPHMQEYLVRSSVDAHIKKIQAQQVKALAADQLTRMQTMDQTAYVGRKVRITVIDPGVQPIESYWYNDRTGQENVGVVKKGSILGIVQAVSLDKNALILLPSLSARLFNPARKYFLVYVINPQTLLPAVQISLL